MAKWTMAGVQYLSKGSLFPSVPFAISFAAALLSQYVITKQESGHWFSLSGALLLTEKI